MVWGSLPRTEQVKQEGRKSGPEVSELPDDSGGGLPVRSVTPGSIFRGCTMPSSTAMQKLRRHPFPKRSTNESSSNKPVAFPKAPVGSARSRDLPSALWTHPTFHSKTLLTDGPPPGAPPPAFGAPHALLHSPGRRVFEQRRKASGAPNGRLFFP